jgi:hypothetical protein
MKYIFILYAIIAIALQVIIGKLTGYGQGSVGLLIFIFLLEIDPRFKFKYMVPNIKQKNKEIKNNE